MAIEAFPCLDRIDWDLLHRQKLRLVALLDRHTVTEEQDDSPWGIVHLLDALQDDAEAAGLWRHPQARSHASTAGEQEDAGRRDAGAAAARR